MQTVLRDFEQRALEVQGYLRMLKAMDWSGAVIHAPGKPSHRNTDIKDEWRKVAKATVYLVIYNNIESAIRSAFAHLYEVIETEKCTLQVVSDEVRDIWIEVQHKKISREQATPESYRKKAAEMVLAALADQVVELVGTRLPIAGNLDARKIREICKMHDVSSDVHHAAKRGVDLRIVKEQRNALAHGHKSFSECGREITVDDLVRIANQAAVFIRGILRNVEDYIIKRRYEE